MSVYSTKIPESFCVFLILWGIVIAKRGMDYGRYNNQRTAPKKYAGHPVSVKTGKQGFPNALE